MSETSHHNCVSNIATLRFFDIFPCFVRRMMSNSFFLHTMEVSGYQLLFDYQSSLNYFILCSTAGIHNCLEQPEGKQLMTIFLFLVSLRNRLII